VTDYPPSTQRDTRLVGGIEASDLYRRLVERHEHAEMLRARVPVARIEFRVDAVVLPPEMAPPKRCAICETELPKTNKGQRQQYCSQLCAREASKIRSAEAAAVRAVRCACTTADALGVTRPAATGPADLRRSEYRRQRQPGSLIDP
jgi:hypothetical protein